jgi:hypothetical protein
MTLVQCTRRKYMLKYEIKIFFISHVTVPLGIPKNSDFSDYLSVTINDEYPTAPKTPIRIAR